MNRPAYIAWLLAPVLATAVAFTDACADVKVSAKIEKYRISGNSGEALMTAMDRSGPRHGFLARAIAQTRYSVAWDIAWKVSDNRSCRVEAADVILTINYRYPELATTPTASMKHSWSVFMKGVRRHEEHHGRVAAKMARAAQKAVERIRAPADPGCHKAKREVSRVVKAVYAKYEAEQARFDALEHRPGGTVDRLVSAFIRRK